MLNRLLPRSEFVRNVLTLITGTTIAQAIPIAIGPILTRIYTPEEFGLYGIFIVIVFIFCGQNNQLIITMTKKIWILHQLTLPDLTGDTHDLNSY